MQINKETLNERRFDFTVIPDPEVKLLTINNNLILSASNFCLLTGAPKVGKSTYTSVILASYVANKEIFGIHLATTKEKPKIALFDTEQAKQELYKSIQRVMFLSKQKEFPNNFDIFSFRKDEANTIKDFLEFYIKNNLDCGTIIIDGLLDLVFNFNEERECKSLIDFLKRITAEYNIGIIAILHTGKTTGTSVGHLGSFADRYCQSNLEITKDTTQNTINIKPKLLRSCGDFEPIALMRTQEGDIFQVSYNQIEEKMIKNTKK